MKIKFLIALSILLFNIFFTSNISAANWGMQIEGDLLSGNKNQDGLSEALSKTSDLGNLKSGESGRVVARQFFRKYYGTELLFYASINNVHFFGGSFGYHSYAEESQSFQIVDSKSVEQRTDKLSMNLSSVPLFLNYYYKKPVNKIYLRFGAGLGVFGIQYKSSFSNGKDSYDLALESGGVLAIRLEAGIGYEISKLFSASFILGDLLTANLDPFILSGKKGSSSFKGSWKTKSNGSLYISSSTSSDKLAGFNLSAMYIKFAFSYKPF